MIILAITAIFQTNSGLNAVLRVLMKFKKINPIIMYNYNLHSDIINSLYEEIHLYIYAPKNENK